MKDGVVKTTPLNSILNGITRKTVIEYLTQNQFKVQEIRFTRDELWCADEAFLTGTAAEITPIQEIDYRQIGNPTHLGKPGPITSQIQKDFQAIVHGKIPQYAKTWLTPLA